MHFLILILLLDNRSLSCRPIIRLLKQMLMLNKIRLYSFFFAKIFPITVRTKVLYNRTYVILDKTIYLFYILFFLLDL